MLLKLMLTLPLLFGLPDFSINWTDRKFDSLTLQVRGYNEVQERCLKNGLEVRYRYELQLCRRRTGWFHACKEQRLIMHSLQFDPISQTYKVTRDRLGDDRPSQKNDVAAFEEALLLTSRVENLPLSFLAQDDTAFADRKRLYVSSRVMADCHGQYNATLARVGYFLTLGLIKVSAFSSGWIDFDLEKS